MPKIRIFEVSNKKLFAVSYADNEQDALELLQIQWTDTAYLREFFTQFRKDYYEFYGSSKINRLIKDTISQADILFEKLIELSKQDKPDSLEALFEPLDDKEIEMSYDL